ncbi:MAG: hypothetical protein WAO56_01640 [Miniphocaeibacter sp.]|uniref:hypothetical protein n=1 Tax=Miniphocaeibacter sp. TaxID=3100973 RepID=UPI0017BA2EB5|nr:DNA-binding protein [Gallicola sp.]
MEKTIKQLADELGVSKDKIKYQVRKLPSEYLSKKNGITYLSNDAITIIKNELEGKIPNKSIGNKTNLPINFTHQIIKDKNTEIEFLKNQIERLNNLLDQQQKLNLISQNQLENKILELREKEDSKKWWQFWK